MRNYLYLGAVLVALAKLGAQEKPADEVVTFKSEVSLVRVDVQALGRDHRALNHLTAQDFVIRDGGQIREIRNFAQESLPVDVLFLIDVSGSMRPHVERMASAAQDALNVMGKDDRVGIMVFDRASRMRLPFRSSRSDVHQAFSSLLSQETFDGGTDITRGLLDAAAYVQRNARKEARRAIVILTDDRTQRERDDVRVGRALVKADAVLSALITPDAMVFRQRSPGGMGGGWPGGGRQGGGGWPGGIRLPGGVILGGGGGGPMGGPQVHSAGTSEIARESGGDSLSVDDGEALEITLSRIRQRYALYFLVPPGVRAGEERQIEVTLASNAQRRYPDAEVLFRRTYIAPSTTEAAGTTEAAPPVELSSRSQTEVVRPKRRPGVIDESRSTSRGPAQEQTGGWKRAEDAPPAPASTVTPTPEAPKKPAESAGGGWRVLKPGEKP